MGEIINEPKKVMSAQQKGLIIGIILVLVSIVIYVLIPNMADQQKWWSLSLAIMVGGIVWACWKFSDDMYGNVTFGNVFGHGFKATAVMTIVIVLYFILAVTVVFPEMKEKAMEVAMNQMMEKKNLSDADMKKALEMQEKFFLPFGIAGQLVMSLIIGAIASLIGAVVAKKNPNPSPF